MIIVHPRIHTLAPMLSTPDNPWGTVEALRVQGGVVTFAGTEAEAMAQRANGEEVWKPQGACVLPGLIDSHAHLTGVSMRPGALEGSDETPPWEWAQRVRARAEELGPGPWVTGRAWNQAVWDPEALAAHGVAVDAQGFPDHSLLTEAAPHNPVVLHRTDQHAVWVNARALELAGIGPETPDPEGGRIVRDAQGAPTGVLVDEAMELVLDCLPALDASQRRMLLRENIARYKARGVTCVHCALIFPAELWDYREVLHGGRSSFRVRGMVYDEPEALAQWASGRRPQGDGWWRVETIKAFADGALGSRGAWFFEPYVGQEDNVGLSVATPAQLEALARAAREGGWQLATHAIGARAIHEVIEAYARAGWKARDRAALRWRIEHVQHPRPQDLDRMAALALDAAMQPIHATRDMRFVEATLGAPRAAMAYPWAGVLARGIAVGFGSDYPIETLDPWAGIHAAVTRQDEHGHPEGGWFPEHRVSTLEAVTAYTRGAAALMRCDEGRLGHLAPGATADLIAPSVDPATDPVEALLDVHIQGLMVGGIRASQN